MDVIKSFTYSLISGKLKHVGRGTGGEQQENKGAGYEASNCFMPPDVSKIYQSQIHRPPEHLELAQSL